MAARVRLRQGRLAAALALGTAAAVPTVVAFSEDPRALCSTPWQQPVSDAGTGAAVDAGPWSISRTLEGFLDKVQQHDAVGMEAEEMGVAGYEHLAAAGTGSLRRQQAAAAGGASLALPAAASEQGSPAARDHTGAASIEAVVQQQQQQQGSQPPAIETQQQAGPGRQRVKFRRTHDVSPSQLAAQHAQEMQHMRQLAAAELARLHASSATAAPAGDREPQQHQQQLSSEAASERHQAGPASATATAATTTAEERPQAGAQPSPSHQQQQQQAAVELPPRFTDAELMRFAIMHGLLRAASEAERRQAMVEGAAAAARTAAWLERHPFSSDQELQQFGHLVSWQGRDAAGRPILHISIGRAVSECRGPAALAFANAIITHMEHGVQALEQRLRAGSGGGSGSGASSISLAGVLGDDAAAAARGPLSSSTAGSGTAPPEQIVVVMDCAGASTLNAARISWVFKAVAATLNHHYPGRLHELVLLDLPVVLGWMVKGIKQLVHPDTRHKFKVVSNKGQQ